MTAAPSHNSIRGFAIAWLALWLTLACGAWIFTSGDFDLRQALHPPLTKSGSLLLGADTFGRPLLSLVPRSSFGSLLFGAAALALSLGVCVSYGVLAAFAPRWVQNFFAQFLEFLIGIPGLILALAIGAIQGPGWSTLLVALILGILPGTARLVQARTRELLLEDYINAARALGAGRIHIILRHLLRGLRPVITAKLPGLFAHCLLAEATLSFLGVGAPLGSETWGALLAQGRDYLLEAPQIAFMSGIPLVLTLLAVQTLGDQRETR
jgi:peptide/nickel transport system permease protein